MLAINQLIKILLGVFVVVAVAAGLYLFGIYITDFFGNFPGGIEEQEESVGVIDTERESIESQGDDEVTGDGANENEKDDDSPVEFGSAGSGA